MKIKRLMAGLLCGAVGAATLGLSGCGNAADSGMMDAANANAVAGGSSDMFETPSSYSFLTSSSLAAGSTVTFTDSNGTVLATMTFANSSSKMVMSAPENSVTCYTGGTLSGTTYFPSSTSDANRSVVCGYGGTISGGTTVSASSGGGGGGWNW